MKSQTFKLTVFLLFVFSAIFGNGMESAIENALVTNDLFRDSSYVSDDGNYIVEGIFLGDSLIEIKNVIPVEELEKRNSKIEYISMGGENTTGSTFASGQGILPNLELPIKFPSKVARYIGQGGEIAINGSEKLEFGVNKSEDLSKKDLGMNTSPLPEILSKQHMDVSVQGKVGQRIFVNMHQNSDEDINSLANNINIEYKGDEDDIIHNIKAGNVDMLVPNTRLIGALPAHKGLFGINMKGAVGPAKFTFVASKEQSQTEKNSFVGQSVLHTDTIWDTEFIKNKYYILGLQPDDSLIQLFVFRDDNNGTNDSVTGAKPAICYIDPQNPNDTSYSQTGRFNLLEAGDGKDYTYDNYNGILKLTNTLQSGERLAVSYIKAKKGHPTDLDTVGTVSFASMDTLRLKLIVASDQTPAYPTWDLMLRNIYEISVGSIIQNSFSMQIYHADTSNSNTYNGKSYMEILGIGDSTTIYYGYVNYLEGYIIFPELKPFLNSQLPEQDSIYNKASFSNSDGRKYYIVVTYRGLQQNYNLNAMNILEGSEVVTVDGEKWERGIDYTIDYETGVVKLLKRLSNPDAKVNIDYQISPLFSTSSKSLLGFNTQLVDIPGLNFSTSWLYKSEKKGNDHPTLDELSSRDFVGEADLTYTKRLQFVDDLLNRISFINNPSQSQLQLASNFAFSDPKLNVFGQAYIDDMEGINLETSLMGGSYIYWHNSGVPVGQDTMSFCDKLYWFNPHDGIKVKDLYPNYPLEQLENTISVLKIIMKPHDNSALSWGGITNVTYPGGEDYSKKDYIELWVKGDAGELHIDIGTNMSEDAPRRNRNGEIVGYNDSLDTEDRNHDGLFEQTSDSSNEDTGIDGVCGTDGASVSGDDGNDDYKFYADNPDNYLYLNGTEGNRRFDTEDLDGDGTLNRNNDYFEIKIDLTHDNPVISRANGWKLYRIFLKDAQSIDTVGNPTLEHVKYVRLWINGFTTTDSISIARFNITGNKWEIQPLENLDDSMLTDEDSIISVSSVNNQENKDYTPPFNIQKTQYGSYEKEQSLVVNYNKLPPRNQIFITEAFSRSYDYINYKKIGYYIYNENSGTTPEVAVRFYTDDNNYYEYSISVDTGWNYISVPISAFTDLKSMEPDTINVFEKANFKIVGRPSFRRIKKIGIGLKNKTYSPLSGKFYVDDIKLTDQLSIPGYSTMASSRLNIGGVLALNFSVGNTNSNFKPLNQTFPSGNDNVNLSYQATFNADKFIPARLGITLPVSYSYSSIRAYPKYIVNSDIILNNPILRDSQKTLSAGRVISVSYGKSSKFGNPILHLIDPIKGAFSYSKSFTNGYLSIDSVDNIVASFTYNYPIHIKKLKLFNRMPVSFFPNTFGFTGNYSYNFTKRMSRSDTAFILTNKINNKYLKYSLNTAYQPFNCMQMSYKTSLTRDLNQFRDTSFLPGTETYKSHTFNFQYSPTFFSKLKPSFNYQFGLQDNHNPDIQINDSLNLHHIFISHNISSGISVPYSSVISFLTSLRDKSKDTTYIKGSPGWFLVQIDNLSNSFRPLSFNYTKQVSHQDYYITGIPNYKYIFGLEHRLSPSLIVDRSDLKFLYSDSYSLSTGFNIPGFSLTVQGSYSTGDQGESGTYNVSNVNNNLVLPDITASFSLINPLKKMKGVISNPTLSLNYRKNSSLSGTKEQPDKTASSGMQFSPTTSFTLMDKYNCNLSYQYNRSMNISESMGQKNGSDKISKSLNGGLGYSFSAPNNFSIPLFGSRLKLRRSINTNINFSYSDNNQKPFTIKSHPDTIFAGSDTLIDTVYNDTSYILGNRTVAYSFTGSLDFTFSNDIKGGIDINYSLTDYKNAGTKIRNYGFQLWMQFNF